MTTYTNFDNTGLNSNSNEVDLSFDLNELSFIIQTTSSNRNNVSSATNPLVSSANLTSQASHNYYGNMLPTPEGSDTIMYNIVPSSGHMNIDDTYKEDNFILEPSPFYIPVAPHTPQISPTLSPDASMSIASSPRHNKRSSSSKIQKVSSNNNNSQSKRKSINISSNSSPNGQYNANTNLSSIMTGSPNSNSIMLSLLELTSPLMNNMVATSIAPLQETMPNLSLGLVSDVTNTHSSTNISDSSSDRIAPITPSSLMKRKQPNSPKSGQNESSSNSQQLKIQKINNQDQLQLSSKDDNSTFIAPTPPTQLNQIRVVTTGSASPSSTPIRKSTRNPNALSPLALGPKSPHSLKPTISPNLKPKLPGLIADDVAEQLATKSNYRSILEGTAQSLGISYSSDVHSSLESRRTTHKAAEQKRRDSLKQSFDELKKVVPHQPLIKSNNSDGNISKNNSNGKSDGSMKNVSKLFLLKRAHDYIVELEQKLKAKDEIIQKLNDELEERKRIKRQKIQKIEETEKEENTESEVDTEMKSKDEEQMTSSNEC